jgi:peptidyl-prolyl cis-trans isomerase SurA
MKTFYKVFVLAALLLSVGGAAQAADRIVAVVNDQVITSSQLDERIQLNLRQLDLNAPNAGQRAAVAKRTLAELIDEELQRQYAAQAKLKLDAKELEGMKANALKAVGGESAWASLSKGLEQTSNDKIAAEALWQKIVARDVQPRVQVSTAEADRLIGELAKSRHVLDREISVIQLNPGNDAASDKAQLDKLTELKQKIGGDEDFNELARAYSDDKSAVNGGKLGWFGSGELNPQLEEALDKMQPGQMSEPIRTPMGWYLVKLDNVRTTKPVETGPQTQVELFLLAAPSAADAKAAKKLDKAFDKATGKMDEAQAVRDYFEKAHYADAFPASKALGWLVQDDLETGLSKAVGSTKPGRWSNSVTVDGTTARVFVAGTRQMMPEKLNAYREKVMNNIFGNRVELEARRFMQNLRQRAFLDVRL